MRKRELQKLFVLSIVLVFIIPVITLRMEIEGHSTSKKTIIGNLNSSDSLLSVDNLTLPEIDYDALNDVWVNQKLEMLIIVNDSSFVDSVTPLMNWKNEKGVNTIILYNYSKYDGRDKAEQIRNMIKDYYEKENIQWILLAGDAEENLIPIRNVYNPDVVVVGGESEHSNWNEYYKPTDYYYADLTGSWDSNNNSIWGESAEYTENFDEISWVPEVYVGRLPADDAFELSVMVNKTLKYETDPFLGNWMNRMLLAGGISSYVPPEDEARLTELIWENYTKFEMNFTHLTKTTSSFTPVIPPSPNLLRPLNNTSFIDEFNSGYSTVIIAGHSDPTMITDDSHTVYYDNDDALATSNANMPSLFYADACTTSSYDMGDYSIGERLINEANSGAIGYIGGLRVDWYLEEDDDLEKLNRGNAKLFWDVFFKEKKFQQGRTLYDSKVSYMNSDYFDRGDASMIQEWQRKNLLTYNLLGDPELDIYTKVPEKVSGYFNEDLYEGQCVSFQVKDDLGRIVPRARINLKGSNGKYRTIYADINGQVDFRLPRGAHENYSVLITGHNVIPSYHNFTTLPDTNNPIILDAIHSPFVPTVSDNMEFSIHAEDNHSGIESVFVIISDSNFDDFSIYRLMNEFNENNEQFEFIINKMEPGSYSYIVVARDYLNKTNLLFRDTFIFAIQEPFTDMVLIIASVLIIGLVSVSSLIMLIRFNKYKKNFRGKIEN
ncbi:MAG: C25 family cysteine peptidase [Promethearchaeota archaeon]